MFDDRLPINLAEQLEHLRSQPGIDISRQPKGTIIRAETTQNVYELVVLIPEKRLVQISGNDSRLNGIPMVGVFEQSIYGSDKRVTIPSWIGRSMKMLIQFKNGLMTSNVVTSASVSGANWHYDVF